MTSAACAQTLILPDARAEDGARRVEIAARRIVIRRRYRGVAMALAIEPSAYRFACAADGALWLVHRDAELSIPLPGGAAAQWARFFGLAAPQPRRYGRATTARRPRFLVRRRVGEGERLAVCFAGEREIVARD